MLSLSLYQYGPAIAGLLIAICIWLARRRVRPTLPASVRGWSVVGVGIALTGWIAVYVWGVFPFWMPALGEDAFVVLEFLQYAIPLVLCMIALLVQVLPATTAGERGPAQLAPRTLMTFTPRPWPILLGGTALVVVVTTVLAGLASRPDEQGRYLMYTFEPSPTMSYGTSIYGWYYSVPCLALVVLVIGLTLAEAAWVARPPLAPDRDADRATRTGRVRNIFAVASGGLLLHLGAILTSLFGTSGLQGGLAAGAAGWVEVGTPFAALGPALLIASYIARVSGIALWWLVLLTAMPVGARQPAQSTPS